MTTYSSIAYLITKALACVGLRASRLVSGFDHAMAVALSRNNVTSVIDVGANTGQFALHLRNAGFKGDIYSFEPLPTAFALLQRRASKDPLWHTYQLAIADHDGVTKFFETENSVSSSMLPLKSRAAHEAAGAVNKSEIVVPMRTLESVAANELSAVVWNRAMLKIDVQGAEHLVLKGANTICDQVCLITTEISFQELYQGSDSWLNVLAHCANHGLTLVDIDRGFRDLRNCQLLQADVLLERLRANNVTTLKGSQARTTSCVASAE